jgi:hypothetical protein
MSDNSQNRHNRTLREFAENDLTPPARDVLLSVQATRQRVATPPATQTARDANRPPQRKPEGPIMPSVSTIPMTDVPVNDADHAECPDCGQRFDDTVDAGCATCADHFGYDNPPARDDDNRFNAWDGDDDWAEDHGYLDGNHYLDEFGDDDWCDHAESSDVSDPTIY